MLPLTLLCVQVRPLTAERRDGNGAASNAAASVLSLLLRDTARCRALQLAGLLLLLAASLLRLAAQTATKVSLCNTPSVPTHAGAYATKKHGITWHGRRTISLSYKTREDKG